MFELEGVKISGFPGRVKLGVDDLIGEEDLAWSVEVDVAESADIKSIEAGPDNGVVAIRLDRKTVTQPESVEALYSALARHFPNIDLTKVGDWMESREGQAPGRGWAGVGTGSAWFEQPRDQCWRSGSNS